MPYGIGPDINNIVYFKEVGALKDVPAPKGSLMEGSELRDLASGGARLVGYPIITWHWDFFRAEWYDALRSICPSASGSVVIRTTTNDLLDEFQTFTAKYIWPIELEKDAHRRIDFDLTFRHAIMVVVRVPLAKATLNANAQDLSLYLGTIQLATAQLTASARPVWAGTTDLDTASLSVTANPITVVRSG